MEIAHHYHVDIHKKTIINCLGHVVLQLCDTSKKMYQTNRMHFVSLWNNFSIVHWFKNAGKHSCFYTDIRKGNGPRHNPTIINSMHGK